jgi:hypothetical protein
LNRRLVEAIDRVEHQPFDRFVVIVIQSSHYRYLRDHTGSAVLSRDTLNNVGGIRRLDDNMHVTCPEAPGRFVRVKAEDRSVDFWSDREMVSRFTGRPMSADERARLKLGNERARASILLEDAAENAAWATATAISKSRQSTRANSGRLGAKNLADLVARNAQARRLATKHTQPPVLTAAPNSRRRPTSAVAARRAVAPTIAMDDARGATNAAVAAIDKVYNSQAAAARERNTRVKPSLASAVQRVPQPPGTRKPNSAPVRIKNAKRYQEDHAEAVRLQKDENAASAKQLAAAWRQRHQEIADHEEAVRLQTLQHQEIADHAEAVRIQKDENAASAKQLAKSQNAARLQTAENAASAKQLAESLKAAAWRQRLEEIVDRADAVRLQTAENAASARRLATSARRRS